MSHDKSSCPFFRGLIMSPIKISFLLLHFLIWYKISHAANVLPKFFNAPRQVKLFEKICKNKEKFAIDQQLIVEKILYDEKINVTSPEECYSAWKKVKFLKKLDLSNYNLRSIEVLKDFKRLRDLNLSNNYINDISRLKSMSKLKHLDLSDNCIQDASSLILLRLKVLNLDNNLLSTDNQSLLRESNLSSTDLSFGNQLSHKQNCSSLSANGIKGLVPSANSNQEIDISENSDSINLFEKENKESFDKNSTETEMDFTSPIIDELLSKLKEHQVNMIDVVMLDEINNKTNLKHALDNLGLTNISQDNVITSLFTLVGLLEDLADSNPNRKIYPFKDYQQSDLPKNILKKYQFNPEVLEYHSETVSFDQRLQDLNRSDSYEKGFYEKFYRKISDKVLQEAVYPNEEERTLEQKKSDIILMLASIKNENNGTPDQRSLAWNIKAIEHEPFTTKGQPDSWFAELQYKLYQLYLVYDSLPQDNQVLLISYFLHGGRHCSDAKWSSIDGAFRCFCSKSVKQNKQKNQLGGFRKLDDTLLKHIDQIKAQMLSKFINQYIEEKPDYIEETCSHFNTTWDHLAPQVGLNTIGSRYSAYLLKQATSDFPHKYYEMFTPQIVYKNTSEDLLKIVKKNYLGPLSQLIPNLEFLVIGLLRYYGAIY